MDWDAGWDSGDAEALLALYADSPILLPQANRRLLVGRNSIDVSVRF